MTVTRAAGNVLLELAGTPALARVEQVLRELPPVDQALATQVLPDPASHGKDLGIMNIAQAVPQAVAPLIGACLVAWLGGFAGLYLVSAACAVAGEARRGPPYRPRPESPDI